MRPEERYSSGRQSSRKLQVVLFVVFMLAVVGAVWLYEGDTTGPSPQSPTAPANTPQPES
tara:strand:+ start:215 stop:394 length:180 start_codon:yes stop_codon:yes gene_type:complete